MKKLNHESEDGFQVKEYHNRMHSLKSYYATYGQEHVLKYLEQDVRLINDASHKDEHASIERAFRHFEAVDLAQVNRIYCSALAYESSQHEKQTIVSPLPEHLVGHLADPNLVRRWHSNGLREISSGRVAVVLMAGGQGTRLGSQEPKGVYDIGLPSHRSLFQLQAERIRKLEILAISEDQSMKFVAEVQPSLIRWYIMTSKDTSLPTQSYFERNAYFGLKQDQVIFFQQDQLPCVTPDSGKLLLRSSHEIHYAPNGNGGLYKALKQEGILLDMTRHGITWIHVIGVDNALVRPADPTFVGFCMERQSSCASLIVEKSDANEAVGIYGIRNGKCHVIEYSELAKTLSEKRDNGGRLLFNAANIANHMFSREFLVMITENEESLPFHIARKQMPCIPTDESSSKDEETKKTTDREKQVKTPCLKFEQFVFDVFSMTEQLAFLEVKREDYFAPVKNAPGSVQDSPDTARQAILNLHQRWLQEAGGILKPDIDGQIRCEIAPIMSYAGEHLETMKGRILKSPCTILPCDKEYGIKNSSNDGAFQLEELEEGR